MTRDQLEVFAQKLRAEMEREREERNFFQLERDKLKTFWEITRNQLEESKMAVRSKDREVEKAQEIAEIDMKQTNQKMKHLQYENQTRIGEIRAENMTQLKLAQEQHGAMEQELLTDKRELRVKLREQEEMHELQLQQLKMIHAEDLSKERQRFENEAEEMTHLHEQKLKVFIESSEITHRMDMFEIEERKNSQISNLIRSHEKAFNEMRDYSNDIISSNLALISSWKTQLDELKKNSDKNERLYNEVSAQNKKLVDPLRRTTDELHETKRQLENYNRNKSALARAKASHTEMQKENQSIKLELETIQIRCDKLEEERNRLKKNFEKAVLELQQKTSLKNVFLAKKNMQLHEELAKRSTQPIDQDTAHMQEQLRYNQCLLAKTCKAHNDLLATFNAKLDEFGIPRDDLGFKPIKITGVRLGEGPAGLVAKK